MRPVHLLACGVAYLAFAVPSMRAQNPSEQAPGTPAGQTTQRPSLQARPSTPDAVMTLAPDATVHLRLRQTVSSFGSKADTPVSAIVIQPVLQGDAVAIPLGAELQGSIVRTRRIGLGFASETALVQLQFDTIKLPGSQPQSISLRITRLDNSRETVDGTGTIHGIRATASASKVLSGSAIAVASLDPLSLLFGLSASLSAFRIPESEIIMPVGTELTAVTTASLGIPKIEQPPAALAGGEIDGAAVTTLARDLPYRTATELKHEPSDITSIMFVGSEAAILRALNAAGWARSDALGSASTYGVMRSVVENQGYREGPVSTLVLAGKTPVGAWSKTLDTFLRVTICGCSRRRCRSKGSRYLLRVRRTIRALASTSRRRR